MGFCHEANDVRIAKIIENFCWEEPCLSGEKGALAIFFSGCNLRCDFCQNYEISHLGKGESYSVEQFAKLLSKFDYSKFDSVDLITPTQFSAQILQAMQIFKPPIPIIWNSSGYESMQTIKAVSNFADIFLVDFKFYDRNLSSKIASAADYFVVASKAIKLMTQLKKNTFDGQMMKSGVIIRHLILPGQVKDSLKILDYISKEIQDPFVSIMSQFTPNGKSALNKKISPIELKTVLSHAAKLGLNQGYFQDLDSADDKFVPNF